MATDIKELARELGKITPFIFVSGADYIEVHNLEGELLDNIVVADGNVIWGSKDEYMLTEDKPVYLARAIASTLKDSI